MDVYSTAAQIEVVRSLRRRPSFVLDTFFRGYVAPTGAEEIYFDVEGDSLGVVPFVSPAAKGTIVNERGYQTNSFKPAYIKPKMPLNPRRPLKRMIGDNLLEPRNPAERLAAQIAQGWNDLVGMTFRRLELMAIDAMDTGKVTVVGEGYDTVVVDYGRAAGQTLTLGSTVEWGDGGVSPTSDLDDFIGTVAAAVGASPDIVVMDAKAWKLYQADPAWKDRRDNTVNVLPGSESAMSAGMAVSPVEGGILKATLDGGKVKIWVYQQQYNLAGSLTNMVPDYTVWIGFSRPDCQGTRYFGTVVDPTIGYGSEQLKDPESGSILEYAPKMWPEQDPGQLILMLQSAPLMALTRPNATMRIRVKS